MNRPTPITREVQRDLYAYTAGVIAARREHDLHPIAFAVDHLCETCQTARRDHQPQVRRLPLAGSEGRRVNHFLPTIVTLPADAEPSCAGMWSLFDSVDPDDHAAAKRLCAGCPVRSTCNDIALSQRDTPTGRLAIEGTWAGQHYGSDRKEYRQRNRAKKQPTDDPRCGTENGYDAHRNRTEYPCEPCRDAARAATKARRARREGEAA